MNTITREEYRKIFYKNWESGNIDPEICYDGITTNIKCDECDKCGNRYYFEDPDRIMLSYHPLKRVRCDQCGHKENIHVFGSR